MKIILIKTDVIERHFDNQVLKSFKLNLDLMLIKSNQRRKK